MRVVFLGTGTSHGVPMIGCECAVCQSTDRHDRRLRTSVLIEDEDTTILIDAGPDLREQALAHRMRRLDAILFTHAHADHIAGLDDVRRFNALSGRPMPLYADATALAEIRQRFGYVFDPSAAVGGGLPELRLWTIRGRFCVGRLDILPVPILHNARTILGFRIGGFAYLTDCSGIPESSIELLGQLDVLVLDALRRKPHPSHFSLDQAVAMASRLQARQTYFTHMAHDLGHVSTCATLPPRMSLAYDGLTLEIH